MRLNRDLGYRHHLFPVPVKIMQRKSINLHMVQHVVNPRKRLTIRTLNSIYLNPATPRTTRLSLVSVPVLSKQQTSTFPAKGILKGSVQKTSGQEKIEHIPMNQYRGKNI